MRRPPVVNLLRHHLLPQATGLHFRHTDNVIQWLNAMSEKGLPKVNTHTVFLLGQSDSSQLTNERLQLDASIESFWSHIFLHSKVTLPSSTFGYFIITQKQKFLRFSSSSWLR